MMFKNLALAGLAMGMTLMGANTVNAASYVRVPSSYVYKPSMGARHDYCTRSPDQFPNPVGKNADFRGPCAKHDQCYGGHTDKKKCDLRLRNDMRTNCEHAYGRLNPVRKACLRTADVYAAAVIAAQ